jgi:hypothetical protein
LAGLEQLAAPELWVLKVSKAMQAIRVGLALQVCKVLRVFRGYRVYKAYKGPLVELAPPELQAVLGQQDNRELPGYLDHRDLQDH